MSDWIAQLERLLRYHLPGGEAALPLWPIVLALVAGFVLCFFGARLVRAGVVLGFLAAGAAAGAHVAPQAGLSTITAIVLGAVFLAVAGYAFFRIWVAALAGAVAAFVTLCVAVGPTAPGLLREFEDFRIAGGAAGDGFALMSPARQRALQQMSPADYGRAFVEHYWSSYPAESRRAVTILGAAYLGGALFGLFAYRWAMVLGTTVIGTMLILAGAASLAGRYWPQALERCSQRPREALAVLLIWFLFAVVAQRRRMRSASPIAAVPAPAAA